MCECNVRGETTEDYKFQRALLIIPLVVCVFLFCKLLKMYLCLITLMNPVSKSSMMQETLCPAPNSREMESE